VEHHPSKTSDFLMLLFLEVCDWTKNSQTSEPPSTCVKKMGTQYSTSNEDMENDEELVEKLSEDDIRGVLERKQKGEIFIGRVASLLENKEILIKLIKKYPRIFRDLDKKFKKDKEIVMAAITQPENNLFYADKRFHKDREMVMIAITHGYVYEYYEYPFHFMDDSLRNDKELFMAGINSDRILRYAGEELKNDKEFMLMCEKVRGSAFSYASDRLKSDKETVLEFVRLDGKNLKHASDKLQNDKDVVVTAWKNDKSAISFASLELKNDKEFMLEIIKQMGESLKFASEDLRSDKEVVLVALKNTKEIILSCVGEDLKNDLEVVLLAVKTDGNSLQFASVEFQGNKEIVGEAIKNKPNSLQFASSELKNDKEFILKNVGNLNQRWLGYVSKELKSDFDVVMKAVNLNGLSLEYSSLKDNKEIAFAAVMNCPNSIRFVSNSLKDDRDFMISCIQGSKRNNEDFHWFQYITVNLKNDKQVVKLIVEDDGMSLKLLDRGNANRNDAEVVLSAIKNNKDAIQFGHPDLMKNYDFLVQCIPLKCDLSYFFVELDVNIQSLKTNFKSISSLKSLMDIHFNVE
jgi:hypothetical protein